MRTARAVALPVAALLWVVIILATPLAAASSSARHGVFVVYRAASLICHQKAERSFVIGRSQMPVCGRCFGLYAAGAFGALAALLVGRRSADSLVKVIVLGSAALPMGLSVGLELLGLVEGTNAIRFASALPLGVAAGWLMEQVLLDENRTAVAMPR